MAGLLGQAHEVAGIQGSERVAEGQPLPRQLRDREEGPSVEKSLQTAEQGWKKGLTTLRLVLFVLL